MSSIELPVQLLAFIAQYVHSIEQLEILLLVARDPKRVWSASDVYDVLLTSPQSIARWLDQMERWGLIARVSDGSAGYVMNPDDTLRSRVDELRSGYHDTPTRVIETIYRRDTAAQSFADAFKINHPKSQ